MGGWEVLDAGGEVCRDGCGVGDQEMENVRSEERIVFTKVQTHIICAVQPGENMYMYMYIYVIII